MPNILCEKNVNRKSDEVQPWTPLEVILNENVLREHRSTTPLALELSKVSLQFFFFLGSRLYF